MIGSNSFSPARRHARATALVAALCLAACWDDSVLGDHSPPTDSPGSEGRLGFSFVTVAGCALGCPFDRPVVEGTAVGLGLRPLDDANAQADRAEIEDSTVASLAAFERRCGCSRSGGSGGYWYPVDPAQPCADDETRTCSYSARLTTHATGDTRVLVRDAAGGLVDSAALRVRAAAAVGIDHLAGRVREPVPMLAIAAGKYAFVGARLLDAEGALLVAEGGLRWSIDDPSVVTIAGQTTAANQDAVMVSAVREGSTTVRLDVAAMSASIDVVVTP